AMADIDSQLMTRAIELDHGGDPSPNPHVGTLVANGDKILAKAFHETTNLDHAEMTTLRAADDSARGKTLYITLEPYNREGRTPPCVDAILATDIARVVVGCKDPNPHVSGGGIDRLRTAGVEVVLGVREKEAKTLIKPWAKYITD